MILASLFFEETLTDSACLDFLHPVFESFECVFQSVCESLVQMFFHERVFVDVKFVLVFDPV